jgi:hypothetical protein
VFGFLRRKRPTVPKILYFKGNAEAFQYACKYMARPVLPTRIGEPSGQPLIVGFVNGAAENDFLNNLLESKSEKKTLYFDVSLALENGPVRIPRCGSIMTELAQDTLNNWKIKLPNEHPVLLPPRFGDLVLLDTGSYDPVFPLDHPINYFMIVLRLKPEMSITRHAFLTELSDFDPSETAK